MAGKRRKRRKSREEENLLGIGARSFPRRLTHLEVSSWSARLARQHALIPHLVSMDRYLEPPTLQHELHHCLQRPVPKSKNISWKSNGIQQNVNPGKFHSRINSFGTYDWKSISALGKINVSPVPPPASSLKARSHFSTLKHNIRK
jgi:hypothetical protein